MVAFYAPVKHQRMRPEGAPVLAPDDPPVIGAFQLNSRALEGERLYFQVKRLGGFRAQEVEGSYVITSTAGPSDLSGPTSGTFIVPANIDSITVSVQSVMQAGLQGNRTIRFEISDVDEGSIAPGASLASMTLEDFIDPVLLPKYQPSVAVNRWHCVGFTPPASDGTAKAIYPPGYTGFKQAVESVNYAPGDVIVLADGFYSGAQLTIARSGTLNTPNNGANHLMIRALHHGRAAINCQLNITGAYVWLTGLDLQFSIAYDLAGTNPWARPNNSVLFTNRGMWITNCICQSRSLASVNGANAVTNLDNIRICFNTLDMNISPDDRATPVICFYNWPASRNAPNDSDIAYNICTQMTKPQDLTPADPEDPNAIFTVADQARWFVTLQSSRPNTDVAVNRNFRVQYNHVRGFFSDFIYSRRNIYIGFNYFEPEAIQTNCYITQRQGLLTGAAYDIGGIVIGNRINCSKKSVFLEINGAGNTVQCNIATGGFMTINLQCGAVPSGSTGGIYDAADFASVIENPGMTPLVVGQFNAGSIMDNSRGGLLNDCRLYRGDAVWTPVVNRDTDDLGNQTPASALVSASGYGPYSKVTPVVASDLEAVGGADDIDQEPEPGDQELPDPIPNRTATVTTRAQLTTMLAGNGTLGPIRPGDQIYLAGTTASPTNYGADLNIDVNGTAPTDFKDGVPVIIKAVNMHGARFTGALTLNGINVWVHSVLFDGADTGGKTVGNYSRFMRCWFRNMTSKEPGSSTDRASGQIKCSYSGKYNKWWYCEFSNFECRPLSGKGVNDRYVHIYKCWWHHNIEPNIADADGRECLQLGQSQGGQTNPLTQGGTECLKSLKALVEYCLFSDVYRAGESHDENEIISVKSCDNIIRFCGTAGSIGAGKNFNIRFGINNEISSCWLASGGGIALYGDDHKILYNFLAGSRYIRVNTGNQTMDGPGAAPVNDVMQAGFASGNFIWDEPQANPFARNCIIAGNRALLEVGNIPGTTAGKPLQRATGTTICAHTGTIRTQQNYPGTWDTPVADMREEGTTYTDIAPSELFRPMPEAAIPIPTHASTDVLGPYAPWLRPVAWGV